MQQNLELREAHQRSLTEMEELRKFQSSTFDTIARRKLVEDQNTILELSGRIQELQNEINCTKVLSFLAQLRCEPEMTVHLQMKVLHQRGQDSVKMVLLCKLVLATLQENFCDGQSLASPGRWLPDDRKFSRQIGGWVL